MISGLTPSDPPLSIDMDAVVRCFKRTQFNKAPGVDNICGHALTAEQLGGVFQVFFQNSLADGIVPQLWKHSTVIPIPKKRSPRVLNDLRPVALTSLVMKAFERITKVTTAQPDPLQFTYHPTKDHGPALDEFVEWCGTTCLELNVTGGGGHLLQTAGVKVNISTYTHPHGASGGCAAI
ncbi:hypothetical protein AAFF_G00028540 [Aldrovandia affinis]|uniref:Reverse transcriptase domain-containing protein n=1 Tax=Aldrovandia affinis TaxID=143900 RepID=A0AAD7S4I4_9TELE|nr:hypothetical protein AAFF_G00028540 [Aldrovandia affinis]